MRVLVLPFLGLLIAGCSIGTSKSPLIPAQNIAITSGNGGLVSFESIAVVGVAIGAVHVIYDPLAPNWEISETRLDERSYRLHLEMKRFNTGGDGDALFIIRRRAKQLQELAGFGGYQLQSFDQRIDSQTIGARRMVEAIIVLYPAAIPPPVPLVPPILMETVASSVKPSVAKKTNKAVQKPVAKLKNSASSVEKSNSATSTDAGSDTSQ